MILLGFAGIYVSFAVATTHWLIDFRTNLARVNTFMVDTIVRAGTLCPVGDAMVEQRHTLVLIGFPIAATHRFADSGAEIGRASCRERVWSDV